MPFLSLYPPILLHWYELPSFRTIIATATNPDLQRFLFEKLNTTFLPYLTHLLPALALSALFISSAFFTESISSSKYPAYKAYQKRVAMFGPSMSFIKVLKIKLVDGAEEEKEIEKLVWGSPHVKQD
jgi:hypothetical protein